MTTMQALWHPWTPSLAGLVWLVVAAPAGAQTLAVKHPVLDHQVDPARAEQYEAAVEDVMAMS